MAFVHHFSSTASVVPRFNFHKPLFIAWKILSEDQEIQDI